MPVERIDSNLPGLNKDQPGDQEKEEESFEEDEFAGEARGVKEAKKQVDDVTHRPKELIEGEGDYKKAEDMQLSFVELVDSDDTLEKPEADAEVPLDKILDEIGGPELNEDPILDLDGDDESGTVTTIPDYGSRDGEGVMRDDPVNITPPEDDDLVPIESEDTMADGTGEDDIQPVEEDEVDGLRGSDISESPQVEAEMAEGAYKEPTDSDGSLEAEVEVTLDKILDEIGGPEVNEDPILDLDGDDKGATVTPIPDYGSRDGEGVMRDDPVNITPPEDDDLVPVYTEETTDDGTGDDDIQPVEEDEIDGLRGSDISESPQAEAEMAEGAYKKPTDSDDNLEAEVEVTLDKILDEIGGPEVNEDPILDLDGDDEGATVTPIPDYGSRDGEGVMRDDPVNITPPEDDDLVPVNTEETTDDGTGDDDIQPVEEDEIDGLRGSDISESPQAEAEMAEGAYKKPTDSDDSLEAEAEVTLDKILDEIGGSEVNEDPILDLDGDDEGATVTPIPDYGSRAGEGVMRDDPVNITPPEDDDLVPVNTKETSKDDGGTDTEPSQGSQIGSGSGDPHHQVTPPPGGPPTTSEDDSAPPVDEGDEGTDTEPPPGSQFGSGTGDPHHHSTPPPSDGPPTASDEDTPSTEDGDDSTDAAPPSGSQIGQSGGGSDHATPPPSESGPQESSDEDPPSTGDVDDGTDKLPPPGSQVGSGAGDPHHYITPPPGSSPTTPEDEGTPKVKDSSIRKDGVETQSNNETGESSENNTEFPSPPGSSGGHDPGGGGYLQGVPPPPTEEDLPPTSEDNDPVSDDGGEEQKTEVKPSAEDEKEKMQNMDKAAYKIVVDDKSSEREQLEDIMAGTISPTPANGLSKDDPPTGG